MTALQARSHEGWFPTKRFGLGTSPRGIRFAIPLPTFFSLLRPVGLALAPLVTKEGHLPLKLVSFYLAVMFTFRPGAQLLYSSV